MKKKVASVLSKSVREILGANNTEEHLPDQTKAVLCCLHQYLHSSAFDDVHL